MCSFPLVSIGLTTYNRPAHLKNALQKLSSQTYKNIEIILADDNPTNEDNFLIYKNSFSTDNRIKYYKKTINEGMNLNFSYALSKAKGKFFMWAADDDDWELDFIEKCVNVFKKTKNTLLVISKVKFIDQDYNIVGTSNEDIHTVGLKRQNRFQKYFLNSQIHNVGFYGIYRTDKLKECYLPNYLSNDRLVLLELSLRGEFVQYEGEGFYYNVSGSSKGIRSYLQAMKIESKFIEHMPHMAFNLLHVKGIIFKWKRLNIFSRMYYLFLFFRLIRKTGYLIYSINQLRKTLKSRLRVLLNI